MRRNQRHSQKVIMLVSIAVAVVAIAFTGCPPKPNPQPRPPADPLSPQTDDTGAPAPPNATAVSNNLEQAIVDIKQVLEKAQFPFDYMRAADPDAIIIQMEWQRVEPEVVKAYRRHFSGTAPLGAIQKSPIEKNAVFISPDKRFEEAVFSAVVADHDHIRYVREARVRQSRLELIRDEYLIEGSTRINYAAIRSNIEETLRQAGYEANAEDSNADNAAKTCTVYSQWMDVPYPQLPYQWRMVLEVAESSGEVWTSGPRYSGSDSRIGTSSFVEVARKLEPVRPQRLGPITYAAVARSPDLIIDAQFESYRPSGEKQPHADANTVSEVKETDIEDFRFTTMRTLTTSPMAEALREVAGKISLTP